jgi:hypothetical protein
MIRVFVSSTFRGLEKERTLLREKLKLALVDVGMEDFILIVIPRSSAAAGTDQCNKGTS